MSQDKRDLPRTAKTGKGQQYAHNKPLKSELFVRKGDGTVLLGQTGKLTGKERTREGRDK